MALEGTLDVLQLPDILQIISLQLKTGILTVQGEHDIIAISFEDGHVVAADALNQTVEEGLGQVLASEGLVSPEDFASVTAEHEAGGKRLVDLLLERRFLDRAQLLACLRLQTYRLLLQLLRWEQGEFKFYSGDEVAYEEGFQPISVEELLIRSMDELGDGRGVGAKLPDPERAYRQVPGFTEVKVVGEDGSGPMDDPNALWLGSQEKRLLERLTGRQPAAEVARQLGMADFQLRYALHRLLQARSIELEPLAEGVAEPAPREALREELPEPVDRGVLEAGALEAGQAEEVAAAAPRARPAALALSAELCALFVTRGAALAGAILLVIAAVSMPWRLALPLPWQEGGRSGARAVQREARYQRIDRAARTFFLLEGRYPDDLQRLVALKLLPATAMVDPEGRPLSYTSDEISYRLEPVEHGEPVVELGVSEAISGDFLLDPEFVVMPQGSEAVPLVLLD